jgi:hypothetical protein
MPVEVPCQRFHRECEHIVEEVPPTRQISHVSYMWILLKTIMSCATCRSRNTKLKDYTKNAKHHRAQEAKAGHIQIKPSHSTLIAWTSRPFIYICMYVYSYLIERWRIYIHIRIFPDLAGDTKKDAGDLFASTPRSWHTTKHEICSSVVFWINMGFPDNTALSSPTLSGWFGWMWAFHACRFCACARWRCRHRSSFDWTCSR